MSHPGADAVDFHSVRLYVMRHGPAEDEAASGRDEDRALSASGRERVRNVARALVDADEAPVRIVSSPLVRALQTAEIVAAATKLSGRGVEVRRELAPGGDGLGLVRRSWGEDKRRSLIVGHEPCLSALIAQLIGEPAPVPMEKAMVVGLSVKSDATALRFVLDPKVPAFTIDRRGPS